MLKRDFGEILEIRFGGEIKMMKNLIACILFFGTSQTLYSQPVNAPGNLAGPGTIEQKNEQDFENRKRAMDQLNRIATSGRVRNIKKTKPLTKEEIKRFEDFVAPQAEDLEKYKDFLQQKETGIFRMFPDFDCETKYLVRTDGDCENFVPLSWGYSFRWERHSGRGEFHDISLKDVFLLSDGFFTQSLLVSLGDVPLENLTTASNGVNYLGDFVPGTRRQTARDQYDEITKGIRHGDFLYSNKLKAEENTTYALRLIAYKYKDKESFRFNYRNLPTPEESKLYSVKYQSRKDNLIAFRIVRKSEDGSVTILWKRLQEKKSPVITFEKNEKFLDFKAE